MLLLEIQQAEKAILKAKECIRNKELNIDVRILQGDTWDKNKYLFTKKLDRDEWDSITEFYNKSRILDESIRYAKKCFDGDVEQIRTNKQKVTAGCVLDAVNQLLEGKEPPEAILKTMRERIETFNNIYEQNLAAYNPQKILDDAQKCIEDLNVLSTTTIGQKLKRISKNKK